MAMHYVSHHTQQDAGRRPPRFRAWLTVLCWLSLASLVRAEWPACVTNQPILFVVRNQYVQDHHNTANFFPSADHEYNNGYFVAGGALKVFDPATTTVRTVLQTSSGVIRDPDVHFSGQRIVFSMRQNYDDSYHIYEINADGTGLRQLTSVVDADDLDPIYLPDDRIAFSSTREPKYIPCNRHISSNLHVMDADGANVNQIGRSTLFEDHLNMMPDGRIMYTRWEYVDRNFGDAQGLWTCDPEGTGHAIYWGNNTSSPGGVVDGRVIPGTQATVCTFVTCHLQPFGAVAIIDRRAGVDGAAAVVRTWPPGWESRVEVNNYVDYSFDDFGSVSIRYEDPYPLADPDTGTGGRYFLCSRQVSGDHYGIYLLDTEGPDTLLHNEGSGSLGCFDPMPLAPRTRPPDVTVFRKHDGRNGRFLVADVYDGTHMGDIQPGDVKYLRVIEAPPKLAYTPSKQWSGQGAQHPGMNWDNFQNKRILGTVPVEDDGSAHFSCPPSTFVYFQLLDENKMMLHSMRSGTIIQPGESQSCIGCHEHRGSAPSAYGNTSLPMAAMREPDTLDGWYGARDNFNYLTEVQPVWDAKCLPCHDWGGSGAGHLILAGDKGLFFNASYTEIWRKGYSGAIGAGPAAIQPAKAWGSHASPLMNTLRAGHEDVTLTREEFERVATWLDLNAPYYPEFGSSYPNGLAGRSPLTMTQSDRLEVLTGRDLSGMAGKGSNPGPQVCFDRPAKSPCLAGLTGAGYDEALGIIQAGQTALAALSRADMPGYQPAGIDAWRRDKHAYRRNREEMSQVALAEGAKAYDEQPLMLVANRGEEGIDGVSAVVLGELLYSESNTPVTVTVAWGATEAGDDPATWDHRVDLPSQGEGTFSLTLAGLTPGANVYFRVFAANPDGTVGAYPGSVFDTRSLIDLDGDGMADNWEVAHFGSDDAENGTGDRDGDGLTDGDEYWVGTDPTDPASCLMVEQVDLAGPDFTVAWQSVSNAVYTLEYTTNLLVQTWIPLEVDRSATPPQNIYTSSMPASVEARHYRVTGRRTDR